MKETITAHHAHGNTRVVMPELLPKTQESTFIELSDGNSMRPMVAKLPLSLETDTALDTRNQTWELDQLLHA